MGKWYQTYKPKIMIKYFIIALIITSVLILIKNYETKIGFVSDGNKAVKLVKNLPKVKSILQEYPNYTVESSLDKKTGNWIVWIYYLGENAEQTSTWGYFEVNRNTGEIKQIQ